MSMMVGLRPFLRAAFAISPASFSEFPDSLAKTIVSGSAGAGGAAGCGTATDASRPAKKPASHARCLALAGPTTRLSRSIWSSSNGAVFGIGADVINFETRKREANLHKSVSAWTRNSHDKIKTKFFCAGARRSRSSSFQRPHNASVLRRFCARLSPQIAAKHAIPVLDGQSLGPCYSASHNRCPGENDRQRTTTSCPLFDSWWCFVRGHPAECSSHREGDGGEPHGFEHPSVNRSWLSYEIG